VGAIYVAAETGPALVERLKKNLDVDVALLLHGKVVASSRPAADLDGLSDLIGQHGADIATLKRTPALPLTAGQDKLLVVAAPFPGQAGEQQAYYALIGVQPAKTDLGALLTNVRASDLRWGNFPWVGLVILTFAMIAVGLVLQRIEVEEPLRKLRRELQRLAAGDTHKIDDSKYHGRIGGLARDVNAAVERFTLAPGGRPEMAEIPVGVERCPLAELRGIGERGPHARRRVRELAHEHEGPLVAILAHLGAGSGSGDVAFAVGHRCFLLFFTGEGVRLRFRCCSSASTCFDQNRRKGVSHSSSSCSGSGRRR